MDKIIFLDIDGVLATEFKKLMHDDRPEFEETTTKVFNRILKEVPEALIVISSTWRLGGQTPENSLKEMKEVFIQRGIDPRRVIGVTPIINSKYSTNFSGCCEGKETKLYPTRHHNTPRGLEIDAWLSSHYNYDEKISYVIIDDDSDMLCCQKDHFVHVNNDHGLTSEDADRAINILNL